MIPDDPYWREFERQARMMREIEAARRAMNPLGETYASLQRMNEEAARREQELRALMGPAKYVRQFEAIARVARETEERYRQQTMARSAIDDAMMRIAEQTERWQQEIENLNRQARAPDTYLLDSVLAAYRDSIERTTAVIDSWHALNSPRFAALLLAPAEGFGRYAHGAAARSTDTEDATERAILEIGVTLAKSQIEESVDVLDELAEERFEARAEAERMVGAEAAIAIVAPLVMAVPARIEGFFVEQEVVVRANARSLLGPDGQPIGTVPTAHRSHRQLAFGRLIPACNKEARMRRCDPPFELSETLDNFLVELGFIDVASHEGMGTLIDGLYFALYESTRQKRRLRPYIGDQELAIVDRVQRVRNRVFRHVTELEQPPVVERQAHETLADLRTFGLDGQPHSAGERMILHDALLDQSLALLQSVIENIRGR